MASPLENLAGNVAEYEGDIDVEDRLVKDLITACDAVATALGVDV